MVVVLTVVSAGILADAVGVSGPCSCCSVLVVYNKSRPFGALSSIGGIYMADFGCTFPSGLLIKEFDFKEL